MNKLTLWREGGRWRAYDGETFAFGSGDTPEQALADYLRQVSDYASRCRRTHKRAKRWAKWLGLRVKK